jgi:hypothetical protein
MSPVDNLVYQKKKKNGYNTTNRCTDEHAEFRLFGGTYCDVTNDLELSPGGSNKLAYYFVNGGCMHLEPVMVLGERRLDHFDLLFQHVQTSHCKSRIDTWSSDNDDLLPEY